MPIEEEPETVEAPEPIAPSATEVALVTQEPTPAPTSPTPSPAPTSTQSRPDAPVAERATCHAFANKRRRQQHPRRCRRLSRRRCRRSDRLTACPTANALPIASRMPTCASACHRR